MAAKALLMCLCWIVNVHGFVFSPHGFPMKGRKPISMYGMGAHKVSEMEPLSSFVMVKVHEEMKQSKGGIVLPEAEKWKPLRGTVISVGPGNVREDVRQNPMARVGENIVFKRSSTVMINDNAGSDHMLVPNEDILLSYRGTDMSVDTLEPAWDSLLLKTENKKETTLGGIVIPQTSKTGDGTLEGKVVRVGGGCNKPPMLSSTNVVAGDLVMYRSHYGHEVRIDGEVFSVVRLENCIAKWK